MSAYYFFLYQETAEETLTDVPKMIADLIISGELSEDFDEAYKALEKNHFHQIMAPTTVSIYKLDLNLSTDGTKTMGDLSPEQILQRQIVAPAYTIMSHFAGYNHELFLRTRESFLGITRKATLMDTDRSEVLRKLKLLPSAGGIERIFHWEGRSGSQVRIECSTASDMRRIMAALMEMPGMDGLVRHDAKWEARPTSTIAIHMSPELFFPKLNRYADPSWATASASLFGVN